MYLPRGSRRVGAKPHSIKGFVVTNYFCPLCSLNFDGDEVNDTKARV